MADFSTYLSLVLTVFFSLLLGAAWLFLLYRNDPTRGLRSPEAISYLLVSAMLASFALVLIRGFGLLDFAPVNDFAVAVSYFAAFVLGAIFGITELVSRYRDEPQRALWSWAAFLYVLVNGLASVFVLNLIRVFGWLMDGEPLQIAYRQVLIAGLGAMALFRSSLFIFRVGEAEINFGPVFVLQIILGAADRAVDRRRGRSRSADVGEIMKTVSFDKAKELLPKYCLALMQNLSEDEQKALARDIIAIEATVIANPVAANRQKSFLLGLRLMSLTGTHLLDQAVKSLGEDIKISS